MVKEKAKAPTVAEIVSGRGYHIVYHDGETNRCPGCGGTQWLLGRTSAECAYTTCGLALEYKDPPRRGGKATIHHQNLHIPERRYMTGVGLIYRRDFHIPERRMS